MSVLAGAAGAVILAAALPGEAGRISHGLVDLAVPTAASSGSVAPPYSAPADPATTPVLAVPAPVPPASTPRTVRPGVPIPEGADGCDHAYGSPGQCVPWQFPNGTVNGCQWLRAHGFGPLPVHGRDRHHLDTNHDGVACGPGDAGVDE